MPLYRNRRTGDVVTAHDELAKYYDKHNDWEKTTQSASADHTPAVSLDNMTVAELRDHAAKHDVKLDGSTTKADIIAAITRKD